MSTDLNWFKSSYSGSQGGDCVEVATSHHAIHIRDSKDTTRPALAVSPTTWSAFVATYRSGNNR
ncbi:DUF397 domain-containing protein [Streptomyces agglomeratus]|uniref:DUF397 domain-containing protein n=1 Tax=Streptomyces agglomeratus TaxID=285458 RepID=A0A1E5PA54_9ACTN|nr:DUF397 domain-containing protein [Streptomyces agglomeratus]OEJ26347.1 DUF397 domain-containing protein [Streptomyces agglomeratus]OEJ39594.1 DUF397 domain-containing protein [Streptomyces agglomeratus]OEJ46022.1 DUF397 domain-containing protein [Streptomyces agglomeratus]OEJ52156.1 DUF397 domain-containing protein [Streptomyces agglomeratus]OEJ59515.1 DUF397 domain-containing protein [Streptomyces agglomeratus]